MSMQQYNKVRLLDVELAIENCIESEAEQVEILELCQTEMKKRPSPFAHCASILEARGYRDVVAEALSIANDR